MSRLSWIITIPVAVVAVVFAISNRHAVRIDLWPLQAGELPLFLIVLGSLLAGFLVGSVVMWLAAGGTRARARRARFEIEGLERELSYLKRKQAQSGAGGTRSGRSSLPAASSGS